MKNGIYAALIVAVTVCFFYAMKWLAEARPQAFEKFLGWAAFVSMLLLAWVWVFNILERSK